MFTFYVNPVIAETQALEYIRKNKVKDNERFVYKYVEIFQNYYTTPESKPQTIEKEIDELILNKTLLITEK